MHLSTRRSQIPPPSSLIYGRNGKSGCGSPDVTDKCPVTVSVCLRHCVDGRRARALMHAKTIGSCGVDNLSLLRAFSALPSCFFSEVEFGNAQERSLFRCGIGMLEKHCAICAGVDSWWPHDTSSTHEPKSLMELTTAYEQGGFTRLKKLYLVSPWTLCLSSRGLATAGRRSFILLGSRWAW